MQLYSTIILIVSFCRLCWQITFDTALLAASFCVRLGTVMKYNTMR